MFLGSTKSMDRLGSVKEKRTTERSVNLPYVNFSWVFSEEELISSCTLQRACCEGCWINMLILRKINQWWYNCFLYRTYSHLSAELLLRKPIFPSLRPRLHHQYKAQTGVLQCARKGTGILFCPSQIPCPHCFMFICMRM